MISVGNEKASDENGIHAADKHVVPIDHVAENASAPWNRSCTRWLSIGLRMLVIRTWETMPMPGTIAM